MLHMYYTGAGTDGINWTKPDVGAVTYNGGQPNNIVWDLHGASVSAHGTNPSRAVF